MAESNDDGGNSCGRIDPSRPKPSKRNRQLDPETLFQKLAESCQALKEDANAVSKAKKGPKRPRKLVRPKMAVYEMSDPMGKKANRNARQRATYKRKKEQVLTGQGTSSATSALDVENECVGDEDEDEDAVLLVDNHPGSAGAEVGQDLEEGPDVFANVDELAAFSNEKELENLVSEYKQLNLLTSSKKRQWYNRMALLEESWATKRGEIFSYIVSQKRPQTGSCMQCGHKSAVIYCIDCSSWTSYLCSSCDYAVHRMQPFHRRSTSVISGFNEPVPSNMFFNANSVELVEKSSYLCLNPSKCSSCLLEMSATCSWSMNETDKCIVINLSGRFDVEVPRVICENCGSCEKLLSLQTVLCNRYWPGSTDVISTLFSQEVLSFWNLLQKSQPTTSESAFLSVLEELSEARNHIASINRTAFTRSFKEFKYCQFELQKLQGKDWMECPPCFETQHSVHADGNCKLKRLQNSGCSRGSTYYQGEFIIPNDTVDAFVKKIRKESASIRTENNCGDSIWDAATNVAKRKAKLDETGLYLCACRHQIAQKALNMFQGEIYAYPLCIQKNFAIPKNVEFFWQDVVCQYWPWLKKVDPDVAEKMTPALSVMHAKGHAWYCEILWGGRWVEGTGLTSGEEVELVNSYVSKLALITKKMLPEGREGLLTECVMHWNSRKIVNLPSQLVKRYTRAENSLENAEREIQALCIENDLDSKRIDFDKWKSDLQEFAKAKKVSRKEVCLTNTEAYIIHLAELCNLQKLPDELEGVNTEEFNRFYKQFIATKETMPKDKRTVEEKQREAILKYPLLEDIDHSSLKRKMQLDLLETLQRQLEKAFLSRFQLLANARKFAETSKHFVKLMKKSRKQQDVIESKVLVYNSLATDLQIQHLSLDDVNSGRLFWMENESTEGKSLSIKRQIVEKMIHKRRALEEIALLKREMCDYMRFYVEKVIPSLEAQKIAYEKLIEEMWHSDSNQCSTLSNDEALDEGAAALLSERYACNVNSRNVALGFLSLFAEGIHFAYSQLKKAAENFSKIYSVDKSVIGATDTYFDRLTTCPSFSQESDQSESDDDGTADDDNVNTFPTLNLNISECSQIYNVTVRNIICDKTEDDVEFLLLSRDISLSGRVQSLSAVPETSVPAYEQRASMFSGFILCYLLQKSKVDMPVSSWAGSREIVGIIQLICHAISQGILIHDFFKACLPDGDISLEQGINLLKEGVAFESFQTYPVFIENDHDELLLEFQIFQICASRRKKIALYTVEAKTVVIIMDFSCVAVIDMTNNNFQQQIGGALIIRTKECKRSFVNAIAKLMDINKRSCGTLLITKF